MSRQSSIEESIQNNEIFSSSHSQSESSTTASFDIQQEKNEIDKEQNVVCQSDYSDPINNNNHKKKPNSSSTIILKPIENTIDITTTTITTTPKTINDITTKTTSSKGLFKKISIKVIEWIRNSLAQGKDEEVGIMYTKLFFFCWYRFHVCFFFFSFFRQNNLQ